MPFFRRKNDKKEGDIGVTSLILPESLKIEKSFAPEDISKAMSELRISSIEREILGESLTRLYEASAEGKITPEERDRLIAKYKEQLSKLDSILDYNQKIIGLYELEETRAEIIKMFHDKFKEVNIKIDEVRKRLGLTLKQVTEVKLTLPPVKEVKPPLEKVTPPPEPRKTKADEELEKLRQDLQKELEKLEQIEIEA